MDVNLEFSREKWVCRTRAYPHGILYRSRWAVVVQEGLMSESFNLGRECRVDRFSTRDYASIYLWKRKGRVM